MDHFARFFKLIGDYQQGVGRIARDFTDAKQRIEEGLERLGATSGRARLPLHDKEIRRLEERLLQVTSNYKSRTERWKASFDEGWADACAVADVAGKEIRRFQPALVDLAGNSWSEPTSAPHQLLIGEHELEYEQLKCRVPTSIAFPIPQAAVFSSGDRSHQGLVNQILLRLLTVLPPGQLELTLIDPLRLGQSVQSFLPLLHVAPLVPKQRVLTRSDEIECALGELTDQVEYLIQHRFSQGTAGWEEFNRTHPGNPIPLRLVLVFDAPAQLSDKSLWFLQRLCESGPRCGVIPLVGIDGSQKAGTHGSEALKCIAAACVVIDDLLQCKSEAVVGASVSYLPEEWPDGDALLSLLARIAERYAASSSFSQNLMDLISSLDEVDKNSEGIDVPIGWSPNGEIVRLTLGDQSAQHHVLIAGKTGSGKSNLLHVLINCLCERYSPDEVEVYLLDYKESTEFNIYAAPALPHARLVATESDPEYGVTVLQHLEKTLGQRAAAFKAAGVRDVNEYRRIPGMEMPRILLIIDEFQVLLGAGDSLSVLAEDLLFNLLKQGRAFGIHLVLSTQTLRGIGALSLPGLLSQLGCRLALACGPEDSAQILGSSNTAAAELRSPPEAIINNSNGVKSGNIKLLVPRADGDMCRTHLSELSERYGGSTSARRTTIFSGAELPRMPEVTSFNEFLPGGSGFLIGKQLTFDEEALVIPAIRRTGFNLLISGYDDDIHDGLLKSILMSIAVGRDFDEVVFFSARDITRERHFHGVMSALGPRFKAFNAVSELPLQDIVEGMGARRVALIIDGLDSERALHPSLGFRPSRGDEAPSPADVLKRIAEDGPRSGCFVLAFVERWQRCASVCKDLFLSFDLRIAYRMGEEEAASFVSGGYGRFKGIERRGRAVFVNRASNDLVWFRPYVDGMRS